MPSSVSSEARSLDQRALAALAKTRNFTSEKLRLILDCKESILLGLALALGKWRDGRDQVTGAFAESKAIELENLELREAFEILHGRFAPIPPRERKRFSAESRFAIVVHMKTYGLSAHEAARRFLVDENTVDRWTRSVVRDPDVTTVGSLVKASPPLRSYDDVTRSLVQLLDALRVGGSKKIAQTLARAGRKLGRETVRRWRKNPPPPKATPLPTSGPSPVRANYRNHIWMTDITDVPSFLRFFVFKLVVVLDVFSRFPLAFRVFWKEPTGAEIAQLLRSAAERFGAPKYLVTDRGSQFVSSDVRQTSKSIGTKPRYGALGKHGSIAIIERFWRTLKKTLDLKERRPISLSHLVDRVDLGLLHYAALRPHQGLAGATPAEIYFALSIASAAATPPARKKRAESRDVPFDQLPLEVRHLDPERTLPFLTSRPIDKIAA